jgi:hypothetical protein
MANWWDGAPLAETTKAPAAGPAAGANWWDAAPLAQEAIGSGGARLEPGKDGGPKRLVMDMSEKKSDRGVVDATGRGVAQGFTANFSDEIRGLVEASGANPDDPASLTKLLSGALKYWTGDADAKKKYDETVKRERDLNKTAEDQHPVASIAGNIAGAVALPIGAAGAAATLPGRVAAGSGVGAVLGGAAGAGEGSGAADTLSRAAMGAGVGGMVGAAAPVALAGVAAAGRGIARAAEPITNAFRGFRDPEGEAARRVTASIARDYRNGDPGLAGAEFRAARAEGQPVSVIDLGGETTRALARSSANTSPEGRGVLNRAIDDRFEGQSGRLEGWFNQTFHYPNAHSQQQAIDTLERTVNRTGYERAYRLGDRDIMTPELERLLGAPAVADAMRSAVERGQNRAVVQGMGAFNPRVTVENGVVRFNRGANGAPAYPNLQLWDYTYRELRDASQAAFRAGRNEEGGAMSNLAQTLRNELDTAVPAFGQARGVAASFFRAENALEAGQNFVAQNFGNREARAAIAQMRPLERQLFQDGFVSRFVEQVRNSPDRRNVLNQIQNSPANREKIEIALGPQRSAELETFLRVETAMDAARGAVQGNSTTARQLIEAGLAGGVGYGTATGDWNPQSVFTAAFVGGLARGAASRANQSIDQRVARRVADMLVSPDPRVLQRGMALVARQPRYLDALRNADNSLARVAGEQSGSVPAIQSMGVSRAEEGQPTIPRPGG